MRRFGILHPCPTWSKSMAEKVIPISVDLQRPETIRNAASIAPDVEIVINNAGIARAAELLSPEAIAEYEAEHKTNVLGLLHVAQAFAPVLKANGGGALVQLNSVASIKSFADFATYSASKAASYSLTQALREKLADQGTAVVSVHPGPIKTDMAEAVGLGDIAEPPTLVADGIFTALRDGPISCLSRLDGKAIRICLRKLCDIRRRSGHDGRSVVVGRAVY